MPADPIGQLSAAAAITGQLIAGVRDEQWGARTPCSEWRVRDLVSHLTAGNALLAAALRGQAAPVPGGSTPPGAGQPDNALMAAYRESVETLLAAFGEPGALERPATVPFGTVPGIVALHLRLVELLVHGWDLARATGQRAGFPADLAEQELAFTLGKLADIPAGRTPFAPPRPVADDAPAVDRLAACLGRDVAPAAGSTR